MRPLLTLCFTLVLMGLLFWALTAGGWPFIAGCGIGFLIWELNYCADTGHFYFFTPGASRPSKAARFFRDQVMRAPQERR